MEEKTNYKRCFQLINQFINFQWCLPDTPARLHCHVFFKIFRWNLMEYWWEWCVFMETLKQMVWGTFLPVIKIISIKGRMKVKIKWSSRVGDWMQSKDAQFTIWIGLLLNHHFGVLQVILVRLAFITPIIVGGNWGLIILGTDTGYGREWTSPPPQISTPTKSPKHKCNSYPRYATMHHFTYTTQGRTPKSPTYELASRPHCGSYPLPL